MVLLLPTVGLAAMVLLLATVMLLLAASVVLLSTAPGVRWRRHRRIPALEVDVDAARVLLGRVLEPHLAADGLDPRLQLLHVARRVVPLADDGVQVFLAPRPVGADALFEDTLRLLDVLPVQVDAAARHAAGGVVLPEDELGRLAVIVLHLLRVALALVGELLGGRAIARLVGLLRLDRASRVVLVFCGII